MRVVISYKVQVIKIHISAILKCRLLNNGVELLVYK